MAVCSGRGALDGTHCCQFEGQVCPYYERGSVPGREHVCGLRRELGSWVLVLADERYLRNVQPRWEKRAKRTGKVESCATWQPRNGECCGEVSDGNLDS